MNYRMFVSPFAMAIGVATLGCNGDSTGENCLNPVGPPIPSIWIDVGARGFLSQEVLLDSLSGNFTGAASGSLVPSGDLDGRMLGYGPPGEYAISLNRPGYETWHRTIQVGRGACGETAPVILTAWMVKSP